MTTQTLPYNEIHSADRFGLTLFLAITIHVIVILGITFAPTLLNSQHSNQPPLEITLVHQRSEEAPDKADYLAQANLSGGGNTRDKTRPSSPATMMVTTTSPGTSSKPNTPAAPESAQHVQTAVLTSAAARRQVNTDKIVSEQQHKAKTAAKLIKLNMEISALSAEIERSIQAFSKQIKHRFIAANAREFRDAAYLDAWRSRIERIGNLNYPDEAKRRRLSGGLVLDVAIRANGALYEVKIRRSSGHKILDDAAIRIVKLAAPFAPFPEAMHKDTDVLHIIRGWQFQNNNRLTTSVR